MNTFFIKTACILPLCVGKLDLFIDRIIYQRLEGVYGQIESVAGDKTRAKCHVATHVIYLMLRNISRQLHIQMSRSYACHLSHVT